MKFAGPLQMPAPPTDGGEQKQNKIEKRMELQKKEQNIQKEQSKQRQ